MRRYLTRALRYLPQEIARQVLPDGCHVERSPAAQLAALQDLTEIRALLQAAQTQPPTALATAIERMAPALRALRHGDGGLVLFNGAKEENPVLIDLVLTQAGRGGRAPAGLVEGGFHRLQAGRGVLVVDGGPPPPQGIDRLAHAGTLAMELSVGRERLIVNCGGMPAAEGPWRDAVRATAAHSTLVIADVNSSELKPRGLGRRPEAVEVQRQEANGAHRLEATHDGYRRLNGAIHRRSVYMAESGEDVRGEDMVEAPEPLPYVVRFHLHPLIVPALQQDGETVVLRLGSGATWRFRAVGAAVSLEESIYLGGDSPRPSQQIVLTGSQDGPQLVKWARDQVRLNRRTSQAFALAGRCRCIRPVARRARSAHQEGATLSLELNKLEPCRGGGWAGPDAGHISWRRSGRRPEDRRDAARPGAVRHGRRDRAPDRARHRADRAGADAGAPVRPA